MAAAELEKALRAVADGEQAGCRIALVQLQLLVLCPAVGQETVGAPRDDVGRRGAAELTAADNGRRKSALLLLTVPESHAAAPVVGAL